MHQNAPTLRGSVTLLEDPRDLRRMEAGAFTINLNKRLYLLKMFKPVLVWMPRYEPTKSHLPTTQQDFAHAFANSLRLMWSQTSGPNTVVLNLFNRACGKIRRLVRCRREGQIARKYLRCRATVWTPPKPITTLAALGRVSAHQSNNFRHGQDVKDFSKVLRSCRMSTCDAPKQLK